MTCLGSHSWVLRKLDGTQVHPAQRLSSVVGAWCRQMRKEKVLGKEGSSEERPPRNQSGWV